MTSFFSTARPAFVRLRIALAVGLMLGAAPLFAKDYYVATTGNDANAGTVTAPLKTIAKASSLAVAGDTVNIMPGRYNEALRPTRSGTAGKPIIYRSGGTTHAIITHATWMNIAIDLTGRSYIVIDGLDVDGVRAGPGARVDRFVVMDGSSHVTVRNGNFKYANGWEGIKVTGSSTYVVIERNTIDEVGQYDSGAATNSDVGDAIMVRGGNPERILIQNNVIRHAAHNLISVRANKVIVQDNFLDNSFRDHLGGDTGGRVGQIDGTGNVFQRNYVTGSGVSSDSPINALLKVEGVGTIARYNVFAYGHGEAIMSESGDWTPNTTDSRIYGNTFYRMGGPAWRVRHYPGGATIGRSIFMNNLVLDTRMRPLSTDYNSDMLSIVATANQGALVNNKLLNNLWSPANDVPPRLNLVGFNGMIDMSIAETLFPSLLSGNRRARPTFVNSTLRNLPDFDLASGSAGIDQGLFLTTATAAGNSRRLPVADLKFFCDGYGVAAGDTIQLKNSTLRPRIVSIDTAANTLVLDTAVPFTSGQGVALSYQGAAPDMGAREFGARKLSPPTAVRVQ